ncbi:MAG: STAS domain-containing protein [Christensenellales bacterium]|jgi:anti-sigma B factor antagonist
MNAIYDESGAQWVITIDMDMDLYTVPRLRELMLDCIAKKQAGIELNCAGMGYIDSTGLGVLVSTLNKVRAYDGTITITGLKPHIRKIFKITGLDGIFCLKE